MEESSFYQEIPMPGHVPLANTGGSKLERPKATSLSCKQIPHEKRGAACLIDPFLCRCSKNFPWDREKEKRSLAASNGLCYTVEASLESSLSKGSSSCSIQATVQTKSLMGKVTLYPLYSIFNSIEGLSIFTLGNSIPFLSPTDRTP